MIVLDASVTVKWFASEPGSAVARSLVHSAEELVAPELIQVEVASALVKKAIRQQLSLEEAHGALSLWFEAIKMATSCCCRMPITLPRRQSWHCN
jgi:predicted nucleic acid-binding protein